MTGLGAPANAAGVVSIQEIVRRGRPARGVRLAIVAILCAAATLLNPYGASSWGNVMHSVSDPLIRLIVEDWIPLPKMLLYEWHTSRMALIQDLIALSLFGAFFVFLAKAPTLDGAA